MLALLLTCSAAQAQSNSVPERLQALVASRFAAAKCPGLSVAVGLINEVVFSKAFGMADLEQGVPMRTDSVQRLGSLSKPINGTIIMGLVEEDKLALDASIRRFA